MKVPYFCLFLFILGIEAQRRNSNLDTSDPSTSPRPRGRGRAKFTASSDTLEAETGFEITPRGANRRQGAQRGTDFQTQPRNSERRPSRPVQKPLDTKSYEVKEVLDDTPLKSSRKSSEAPSSVDLSTSTTETYEVAEINKLLGEGENVAVSNDGITKDSSSSQEEPVFAKNEIVSSSENPESFSSGFPQNINDQLPPQSPPGSVVQPAKSDNHHEEANQQVPRRKVTRKKQRIEQGAAESRNPSRHRVAEEKPTNLRSRAYLPEPEPLRNIQEPITPVPPAEVLDIAKISTESYIQTASESLPDLPTAGRKERRLPLEHQGETPRSRGSNAFEPQERVKDRRTSGSSHERRRPNDAAQATNVRSESRRIEQPKTPNTRSRNGNNNSNYNKPARAEEAGSPQRHRTRTKNPQVQQEVSTTARSRTRERGRSRSDLDSSATISSVIRDSPSRTRTGRKIADPLPSESRRSTKTVSREIAQGVTSKPSQNNSVRNAESQRSSSDTQKTNLNELNGKTSDSKTPNEPRKVEKDLLSEVSESSRTVDKSRSRNSVRNAESQRSSADTQKTNLNELNVKTTDSKTPSEPRKVEKDQLSVVTESPRTVDKSRSRKTKRNKKQNSDISSNNSAGGRSRSRNRTPKLEVLPLFESESKPIPTKAYRAATAKPNLKAETEDESKRKEETKKVSESATTARSRVTRRQITQDSTEEIAKSSAQPSTAAENENSVSKKSTQPTVKKSIQVSEVTQITTTKKIGRRRKNSRKSSKTGEKSTTERSVAAGSKSKPSGKRKSAKSDLSKSDEELNESDNYPEPFKSLIKAKKQDGKSSKSKTTEQAKVTEKLQIVTPYTTPVTASGTPSTSSVAPIEHVYFRRDEDKENELESNKSSPSRQQKQRNEIHVTEKSRKQLEAPAKKSVIASSTTTSTQSPKFTTKSTHKKKGRYHARYKSNSSSTTANPNENEISSSTSKQRNFSPKSTGSYSSKKIERSTSKPNFVRSSPKTFSKFNKNNKDSKSSTTQASVSSKPAFHRFSSRYRNDPLKRSNKFLGSTPGPKYIPTVPTITPIVEVQKHGNEEVRIITFDDPVNNIVPSDSLISEDYLLSVNKTISNLVDSEHDESRPSTTNKPIPVSIFESIINSITAISSTPKTPSSQTVSTDRSTTSSAIFRIASKKTKTDKTVTSDVPLLSSENLVKSFTATTSASTTEKPTTIIEKILSSLSAIKANNTNKESTTVDPYENDTIFNTINTTPKLQPTTSKVNVKSTRSLGTSTISPRFSVAHASSSIDPVNSISDDNASLDELLGKRTVTRLFSLLNSISYTSPTSPPSGSDNNNDKSGASPQLNFLSSTTSLPLVSRPYSKITMSGITSTDSLNLSPAPTTDSSISPSTVDGLRLTIPFVSSTYNTESSTALTSGSTAAPPERIVSSTTSLPLTNLDEFLRSIGATSSVELPADVSNNIVSGGTTSSIFPFTSRFIPAQSSPSASTATTTVPSTLPTESTMTTSPPTTSTVFAPTQSSPSGFTATTRGFTDSVPTLSNRLQDIISRITQLINTPTTNAPNKAKTFASFGFPSYPASVSPLTSTTTSATTTGSNTITTQESSSVQSTISDEGTTVTPSASSVVSTTTFAPFTSSVATTTTTAAPAISTTEFPTTTSSSLSPLSISSIFKLLATMPPTTPSRTTQTTTTPFPSTSSSLATLSTPAIFRSLETTPPTAIKPTTTRVTTTAIPKTTYSPGFLDFLSNLFNPATPTVSPTSKGFSLPNTVPSTPATTTGNPLSFFNSLFNYPVSPTSRITTTPTPKTTTFQSSTTASTPSTKVTVPEHTKFEVSPGSVSVFSANDVSSTYTPEEFDSAVSIFSRNLFPYLTTNSQTSTTPSSISSSTERDGILTTSLPDVTSQLSAESSTIDSPSVTTGVTEFPESTFVLPSTTFTNEFSTDAASTVGLSTEVSSTIGTEFNVFSTTSNTNSSTDNIDTTEESNTMTDMNNGTMPPRSNLDFFIFAVLNNNTILRKRPSIYPTRDTPFIIRAILPNNTLVQKFPNGSLVPEEPVIQVEAPGTNMTTVTASANLEETTTLPPLSNILGGKTVKEFNNILNKTPSENEVFKYQTLEVDPKTQGSTTVVFPISSRFFTTTPLSVTSPQRKISTTTTRSTTTPRSVTTRSPSTTTTMAPTTITTTTPTTPIPTTTTTRTTTTRPPTTRTTTTTTTTTTTPRPTPTKRRVVTTTTPAYRPPSFLSTLFSTLQTFQTQTVRPPTTPHFITTTAKPQETTPIFKAGSKSSTYNSIEAVASPKVTAAFEKNTTPSPSGIFDDIFRTIITAKPPPEYSSRTVPDSVATSTKRSISTTTLASPHSSEANELELLNSLFRRIIPSGRPVQQATNDISSINTSPKSVPATESLANIIRNAVIANEISPSERVTKPVFTTQSTERYIQKSLPTVSAIPLNLEDDIFKTVIRAKPIPPKEPQIPKFTLLTTTPKLPSTISTVDHDILRSLATVSPVFQQRTSSTSAVPPRYQSSTSIPDDSKPPPKLTPAQLNPQAINPQVLTLLEQLLFGRGLQGVALPGSVVTSTTTTPTTTTTPRTTTTTPTTTTTTPTTTTTRTTTTTTKTTTTTTTTTPRPTFRPSSFDVDGVNYEELKKKNLTEEQRRDLLTLEALEREQKAIMKQLSFLANLAGLQGGIKGVKLPGQQIEKGLTGSKVIDEKPKLSSTASPQNLLDSIPSSSFKEQKKVSADGPNGIGIADLLKQINAVNMEKITTALPRTTYGRSEDALLASLLKENGIGPTTPKSLADRIRLAGIFDREVPTTTTPRPPPPSTTRRQRVIPPSAAPPSRGPLMQGLSWILNAFSPERTAVPPARPAKSVHPAATKQSAVVTKSTVSSQTTRSVRSTTEQPLSDLEKSLNSLTAEQLDNVIGQLEKIQKSGKGGPELDLTLLKLQQKKIRVKENDNLNEPTKVEIITPAISRPARYTTARPVSVSNFISNAGSDYEDTPVPPVSLDPVPGLGQEQPPVRGQLVNAAINVTKAISNFLGSALQWPSQTQKQPVTEISRAQPRLSRRSFNPDPDKSENTAAHIVIRTDQDEV